MHIHWFNPENDLALANGTATYTPPRAARKLSEAGAVLPLWYGQPDDKVLCYGVNGLWLKRMRQDFGISLGIYDHEPQAGQEPDPWGWSAYAKRYFIDEGFIALPTDATIDALRQLSHRRTGAVIAAELAKRLPDIPLAEPAYEAYDIEQVRGWLATHPDAYIKQPWSSSGRGVLDVHAISETAMLKMADDSIRLQGSVMLERAYDRVIDFARIYECIDGQCIDLGTSVFSVDRRGGYAGNVLAPEEVRLALVGEHYPEARLLKVAAELRAIIEEMIAPIYSGIIGVDMLVDSQGILDAVVEVNLRKTMGYVANRFTEQYMRPDGPTGEFRVMRTADFDGRADYTAVDHKIERGTLLLTPAPSEFVFVCNISPKEMQQHI